jgi:hypothetical protein
MGRGAEADVKVGGPGSIPSDWAGLGVVGAGFGVFVGAWIPGGKLTALW